MTTSSGARILNLSSFRDKKAERCIFCNCPENLYFFRKHVVCLECLRNIRKLYTSK